MYDEGQESTILILVYAVTYSKSAERKEMLGI